MHRCLYCGICLRGPELTSQPPVQHIGRSGGLVVRNHMATSVQPHEGEVTARLEVTNLVAITTEEKVLGLSVLVILLAGPLKRLSPGLVAEPVTDVVS